MGRALALFALLATAGCASLPQAGPTGSRIVHAAGDGQFDLVEVNDVTTIPQPEALPDFKPLPPLYRSELEELAPGDIIGVTFYEVGVRIFSPATATPRETFDPSAKGQRIGSIPIDEAGRITLPYVGTIMAAGRTPTQLATEIEAKMRGKSEFPQVIVQLEAAVGSGVFVSGDVPNPGRVRLSGAHEKLLDIITLAGGRKGSTSDILVRVSRKDAVTEGPLASLNYGNLGGMPMEPGDRVEVLHVSRAYTVMGSANRVNRYELPLRAFPLSEALAAAGGPNEYVANPGAVFVFRFAKSPTDGTERPIVYHLNMMRPVSYLLAQKFSISDKDVVYVAGAEANQPSKLLQLLGLITTPIVIARQVAK